MENDRFSLIRPWVVAVLKTFAGRCFVVLRAVSTAATFLPFSNRQCEKSVSSSYAQCPTLGKLISRRQALAN